MIIIRKENEQNSVLYTVFSGSHWSVEYVATSLCNSIFSIDCFIIRQNDYLQSYYFNLFILIKNITISLYNYFTLCFII